MAFTNPFRYFPDPLVVKAAEEVIARIDSSKDLRPAFSEGKMLGVLIVECPASRQPCQSKGRQAAVAETPFSPAGPPLHVIPGSFHVIPGSFHVIPGLTRDLHSSNRLGYLAAFSGNVGGRSLIDGFVPPIFDLLDPSGHFKIRETEITSINQQIGSLSTSLELKSLKAELSAAEQDRDSEISSMKARMAISKRERDEIRCELSDQSRLAELIRESQFEKAGLKRLKVLWEERISALKMDIEKIEDVISSLKQKRSKMSDELQEWIFRQYIVHNALGEESSIMDIFAAEGLVPPGGTGECAAPKLLEYAFRNGLKPVAMGEFWYGRSPETAVRTHGHFYPSCTSKCGPLLGWMARGLDTSECMNNARHATPNIIYEDEVLVAVDKPSGMPSVPGLDGRESAFEILKRSVGELFVVHRLDMDTSGVLVFAKTASAAVEIQKQFENQTVEKVYKARLSASEEQKAGCSGQTYTNGVLNRGFRLKVGDKGRIELPLSPDYDERPRQKVDFSQGKAAVTDYEIVGLGQDGCLDVLFRPRTGRTHQLRVHAAHTLGLARPILGDPLYGSASVYGISQDSPRLALHAASITFRHPVTDRITTLNSNL